MKSTNATKIHRKSGGAQWRDLQFSGLVLEMFFWLKETARPSTTLRSSQAL
jgi:hypothetical protein